jgi:DNA processing protein
VVNRREQAALLLALRVEARPWAEIARRVEESGSALAVLEK